MEKGEPHSKLTTVLTRMVRIAVRVLLALALVAVLLVALVTVGLFFYASDLPNIQAMSSFAPEAPTTIADAYICGEKAKIVALPTSDVASRRGGYRSKAHVAPLVR